jgi:cytochrome c5
MEFIQSVSHQPDEAEKIYQSFCKNCHAPKPLIPLGAPRIGYSSEWKGRKDLLKSTLEGKGLMPARGGCFECSDEQLKKVIDYMINFK